MPWYKDKAPAKGKDPVKDNPEPVCLTGRRVRAALSCRKPHNHWAPRHRRSR